MCGMRHTVECTEREALSDWRKLEDFLGHENGLFQLLASELVAFHRDDAYVTYKHCSGTDKQ
jgi:hypothetical protein